VISIIVVNYNGGRLLEDCLGSLGSHLRSWLEPSADPPGAEILVVDNGSSDASETGVSRIIPRATVVALGENRGFGYACNRGAERAGGEMLLFLNPDTAAADDFLTPLASSLAAEPSAWAAVPEVLYPDGRVQLTWGCSPSLWVEARDKLVAAAYRWRMPGTGLWARRRNRSRRFVEWGTGACLLVRAARFREIGGFDEGFFLYFEDKDLCARLRAAGGRILFEPSSRILHVLGGLSGGESGARDRPLLRRIYRESQARYYQKHRGRLENLILPILRPCPRRGEES